MRILALNIGSSSLKYALYEDREIARGEAKDFREVVRDTKPDAVGHRIVHGGPHTEHARIDDELLQILDNAVKFAPLHLPPAIEAIRAIDLPQVACFDTHFHARLPEVAKRLPLPVEPEIRKYGFHGLSYEYICSQIEIPPRTIIAHLGSGASLVALQDGSPIDTTMGLTPAGGVVMGTRPGDLDPGVMLYLKDRDLEKMINHESGLKALGGSSDMRELIANNETLAIEAFVRSVQKAIGGYAVLLGGVDLLVFTGGIGAHAEAIRHQIAARLFFAPRVLAMETNEELVVYRHTARLL